MTWRDELISTAAEAEDFLRRHVSSQEIPDLKIESGHRNGLGFLSWGGPSNERGCAVNVSIDATQYACKWNDLHVAKYLQRRAIGLMAVKAGLAVAHEYCSGFIQIMMVRDDGPGFWPMLGAVPLHCPQKLAETIEAVKRKRSSGIDPLQKRLIGQIQNLAEENPYAGWRWLSQTEIKIKDGERFKELVFRHLCVNDSLYLLLSDYGTQEILKKRLGTLPCFPAQNSSDKLSTRIIANLESNGQHKFPVPII